MEKNWFPQQNVETAPIALLKNFIYHLDLSISRLTIEKEVREHPEYPFFSDKGIIEILKRWGIETVSYTWEVEKLEELPPLTILFIHEHIGNVRAGAFVLFNGFRDGEIEYLHTRKGWVLESKQDFAEKWAKAAISILSITPYVDPNFDENEQEYTARFNSNPELKNLKVYNDFLSDEECRHIIELSEARFSRSKLMDNENIVDYGRTSYSAELVLPNDPILDDIRSRAAKLIDIPPTNFEYFQCVSYERTQEYMSHFDTFDEHTENGRRTIEQNGQRKYTLLVYLNDAFEGGSTYFPNLDVKIQPKKGRVVVFNNLDHNEKVLSAAYHAGLPVTTGRKYALNIWVRTKPFRD